MMISDLDKKIIDLYQAKLDICEQPFLEIAKSLNVSEQQVLQTLNSLKENNIISRVGPIFTPNKIGNSCLAALKINKNKLELIASEINKLESVNHNYEREHDYNLWFVITAKNKEFLNIEIDKIAKIAAQDVLVLPLEKEFFIDLGFDIDWESK